MKKFILFMSAVLVVFMLFADVNQRRGIDSDGHMERDANGKRIQASRYIQLYDGDQTGLEHLTENTFATHVNWDVTNDFDDDSLSVRWTFADTARSVLEQVNADQALVVRNGQNLLLTYTIYDSIAIAGGTVSAWITGIHDSLAMDITAGVGKTLAIPTSSSASTGDFEIRVKADGSVTAGKFAIDDVYLTSYYESPLTIANGADVDLYIPTNAVELVIDPVGTDVKIEIGSNHYIINTVHSIPCMSHTTITIANDSGASATVYFYFSMI